MMKIYLKEVVMNMYKLANNDKINENNFIKTLISPQHISSYIEKYFNLNNILNIVLIKAYNNDIYEITTKNNKYILKIFDVDKNYKDIEFEICFSEFINENIILINLIENKKLFRIKYPEGFKYALLMNYIDGNQFNYKNKKDAYLYAINVAKLHNKSYDFQPKLKKEIVLLDEFYKAVDAIINHLKLEKLFIEEFNFIINDIYTQINQIRFSDLTMIYCHGDLHGGNMIYNEEKYIFIDFDDSGYNYVSYELSVFLWSCLIGNRKEHWGIFLDGYLSVNKIQEKDLMYIKSFVLIRDIIIMSRYIKNINIIGKEILNENYISKRIKFLNCILKELK